MLESVSLSPFLALLLFTLLLGCNHLLEPILKLLFTSRFYRFCALILCDVSLMAPFMFFL